MHVDKPNETIEQVQKMDDLEWQQHQLKKKADLNKVLDERAATDKGLRATAEERNRTVEERDEIPGS
jgi:hypothetical protein